jgi:4-hydroxy-tetrahydrodipicolinate synthase
MSLKLEGIIPPMATPFTRDQELDEAALRREVQHMLEAGVHGLTIGGSTGEGHTLSVEESCRLAAVTIDEVKGRVPVISGIIRDSTREVIRYGRALKDVGVDALQITPVHYLFTSGDEGTVSYYDEIGRAVQLPIVVYNVVPWNTIYPPTLLRLAELEWVVGVKQSGGDIHKLADLLAANRGRLRVLSAIDALLYPSFLLGAHGAVAAILTVVPEMCVELWDACQRRDHDRARDLHERILPIWRALEAPDLPARVKAALEMLGRPVGPARHPIQAVDVEVREKIRAALEAARATV